jgi:cation diffusion facilitator CzcD-associated flavoprotein CzcO
MKDMTSIDPHLDYQAVIIGAGLSGIYQIKRLADLGVKATVLEANSDLGGTWFNNRYPGARFDSESYTYGYSFSEEVLEEWSWTEKHSPQSETLAYLNFVADKFELRQYMQFNCRVQSLTFDEDTSTWSVHLEGGRKVTTRFVITALGTLSAPSLPNYDGMDSFEGISFHASNWPHEPLELEGKRVAVIGAGATAIQLIPEVAKKAEQLIVFQRRPNWAAPLNNGPISESEMSAIRERYDEIFATCARTPGGFEHMPDPPSFYDVTPEQRRELWDRLYDESGFAIWLQNFMEIFVDERANAELSDYIAERIRQRVHDPLVAELLVPKDHGFGVQRLPLENGLF